MPSMVTLQPNYANVGIPCIAVLGKGVVYIDSNTVRPVMVILQGTGPRTGTLLLLAVISVPSLPLKATLVTLRSFANKSKFIAVASDPVSTRN